MMLKWNTLLYDGNKLKAYNIFNNYLFSESIEELFKTSEVSFHDFDEYVRKKLNGNFGVELNMRCF